MRTRTSRALPILGSALALAGLTLPAVAADAPSRPVAVEAGQAAKAQANARLDALLARLSPEQRRAVEAFHTSLGSDAVPTEGVAIGASKRLVKVPDSGQQIVMTKRNTNGDFVTVCLRTAEEYALFLLDELNTSPRPDSRAKVAE